MAGYPKTLEELRAEITSECNRIGEPEVRARLVTHQWNPQEQIFAREWLARTETEHQERQRDLEDRSVAASERSAAASERAAVSSEHSVTAARESARWAFWAAIISLITVAVSVIPGCIERL